MSKKIFFVAILCIVFSISAIFSPSFAEESPKLIPDWVKNIFVWYGDDQIGETDVINAIKFLLQKKIIILEDDAKIQKSEEPSERTPITKGEPGTAKMPAGWSTPIKLGFNDNGWEDSPYITRDGNEIIFFYHPYSDLTDPNTIDEMMNQILTNPDESVKSGLDGKLYISHRPFNDKEVHPISDNDSQATECCYYISQSGDEYYNSNQRSYDLGKEIPETVYKNGQRLDFGTGMEEANPHYCDARDEMWFDCPGDMHMCLMKDAAKNNFKGKVEQAPYPINSKNTGIHDAVPYLTDDCNTLYFSSDREGDEKQSIYKTIRLEEDGKTSWTEPEIFITGSATVGEISMTADGKELIFSQIFWRDDGGAGIDTYYSHRK